ncbi:MAG TPA: class I SAM-dependent methyltransferase [Woeseiaceae bacterium]|nr:class I SAM-dependent methyltransferase [Woeseiaceae bacterium]
MSTTQVNESTHEQFLSYTSEHRDEEKLGLRFRHLKDKLEQIYEPCRDPTSIRVLDIGCSVGVQARLWARDGYPVTAIDYDAGLIDIARQRSEAAGIDASFQVGSAEAIPSGDGQFDICLAIELLEHVDDWQRCLDEFCRVLKPGGVLLLTTTNVICPRQNEYRLPLYSWWPGFIKRPVPRLVRDRYPALAGYSPCPAQHWFSIFGLARELSRRNMDTRDRLDVMPLEDKSVPLATLVRLARRHAAIRALFYLFYTGTIVFAFKRHGDSGRARP